MRTKRWLSDDEQRAWRGYLTTHAELMTRLNRQLQRDSSLSLPDFAVLAELTDLPETRMRFGALVETLQWDKSRASHHLSRMERRGLIAREDCPADARGSYITLTDEGRQAIERAAPGHVATVCDLVFDRLTAAEVETLDTVNARVLSRLRDGAEPVE